MSKEKERYSFLIGTTFLDNETGHFVDIGKVVNQQEQQLKEKDEMIETLSGYLKRTIFRKEVIKSAFKKIRQNSTLYKHIDGAIDFIIDSKLLDQIEKEG